MDKSLIIIAHNIRSAHNVGALLRTADGLGVDRVFLTGYTPYPLRSNDTRLPHLAAKLDMQIHKTALNAEHSVDWDYSEDVLSIINKLRSQRYVIAGLEQTTDSELLNTFISPKKLAIIIGSEVTGIDPLLLAQTDLTLEIPMHGKKESFNVIEAASMAMYHCRYVN